MKKVFRLLVTLLILSLIALSFCSCDIMKKSAKSKESLDIDYQEETKNYRKGDSVIYYPRIKYKDTIIYTVNRQGTTLMTQYDRDGNIKTIECQASKIEELIRKNLKLEQDNKNKQSEKTENFDSSVVMYIVIGIVLIVCFMFAVVFYNISKNAKVLNMIIEKISKD